MDYREWKSKNGGRKTRCQFLQYFSLEGLENDDSSACRNEHGENYINSRCISEMEPMVSDGLDVEFEEGNSTKYRFES